MKQASYRLLREWWAVAVGMLIAGALIGDYEGLGIILGGLALTWLLFLRQHRLVYLPSAPTTVQLAVRVQSRRLGLVTPEVYQLRDAKIGASAMSGASDGAVVIVNSGLDQLSGDETNATMAHELAHIRNRDSLSKVTIATAVALVGTMVALEVVDKLAVAAVMGLLLLVSWAQEFRADVLGARTCGDSLAMSNMLRRATSYNWPIELCALFLELSTVLVAMLMLLYVDSLSLLPLVFLSWAVIRILPGHPPTPLRRWLLGRLARDAL